jgi:hypothetical protein
VTAELESRKVGLPGGIGAAECVTVGLSPHEHQGAIANPAVRNAGRSGSPKNCAKQFDESDPLPRPSTPVRAARMVANPICDPEPQVTVNMGDVPIGAIGLPGAVSRRMVFAKVIRSQ